MGGPRENAGFRVQDDELRFFGELDLGTVPTVADLVQVADPLGPTVRIRMSEVTFLDSTGIRLLVQFHRELDARGRTSAIVAPSPAVDKVLRIAGMDHVFAIETDVVDAIDGADRSALVSRAGRT